jgi:hypothetical protein
MCCSGDKTVKATEAAQAAMTDTLRGSFMTAFSAKQDVLSKLIPKLMDAINNPHGFDPKTLALMKTNASDTVSANTTAAQTAANAYLASHGGATLGSGVAAQIKGQIAAASATEGAKENSNIDIQSGLLQNENYWRAINGLTTVANSENPEGIANAEVGSANSVANLSSAYLASKQADWQNTFGIIKGVAGLASAAAGVPSFGGATSTVTPQLGNGVSEGFSAFPSAGYT